MIDVRYGIRYDIKYDTRYYWHIMCSVCINYDDLSQPIIFSLGRYIKYASYS